MKIHTPRRAVLTAVSLFVLLAAGSCGHSYGRYTEVIDLDRVLDILSEVMKQPISGAAADQVEMQKGEDGDVAALASTDEDPALTQQFLERFGKALNDANLMSTRIDVSMDGDGAIYGRSNGTKLFRIDIDPENGRVIASDLQRPQYRRYHRYSGYYGGYGYHGGGGFWMGYMLGSMRGRSDRYYASPGRTRPNYGAMGFAQRGYHKSAQQKARTRAASASRTRSRSTSSARSRSRSFSFRSGK